MKINYTLDENNYIISYTAHPFDNKKPSIEITDADVPYLMTQKCQVSEGKLVTTAAKLAINANKTRALNQAELNELMAWFKIYDEQAIQYARHMRLHGESDIDIAALDAEAETKAARIKELEALLK